MQERCRAYRGSLLASRTATAEELDAVWPGGARNAFRGRGAWLWAHAQCHAFLARRERLRAQPEHWRALNEAAARKPVEVVCSDGTRRRIHPKSLSALSFLDGLKADLVQVLEARALAMQAEEVEELQAYFLTTVLSAQSYLLFAWVVTHPEPGLPFDVMGEMPELPEWLHTLTPEDIVAIVGAHIEVNRTRLALVSALLPEQPGESTLSIEGWVAAYAAEKGLETPTLLSRWSLGELYAAHVSSSVAMREARERAKQATPTAR